MKLKHILLSFLISFGMVSCKVNYYQVYEVKSSDLLQKDNSMVFENDDCKIYYNLWSHNGSMAFIFENKTDKDLFLDMRQTFFIKNGAANDYFKNRSVETSTYDALNLGYSVSNTYVGANGYWPSQYVFPFLATGKKLTNVQKGISSAVTTKEPEYVCIPAKSYKVIDYYNINPSFELTCDKKKDFPKTSVTLYTYNIGNTPLKFKNRIAYSFQKDDASLKHIENSFWLSEIKNYSEKEAIEKRKVKEGCGKYDIYTRSFFKIGSPNSFYVRYEMKK